MSHHNAPQSPPRSRASSTSSLTSPMSRRTPKLSIDLSDLPPLITPSPTSNTLLITNLQDASIFHPSNLVTLRDLISSYAPVHTWAPLRSFRRIVVSFFDTSAAIAIKQKLDGEVIMGDRIRVYFGTHTPLNPADQHLPLPKSDKLFFISPPPSPPHGWEVRDENAPNKDVHAEDLAAALAKLHAKPDFPASPTDTDMDGRSPTSPSVRRARSRSSTIVYHPDDHGDSPLLPAIAVEDTTASPGEMTPINAEDKPGLAHTQRPPVELMQGA